MSPLTRVTILTMYVAVLCAAQATAESFHQAIDRLAEQLIQDGSVVGMSVGVIHDKQTLTAHYGRTGTIPAGKPHDHTVYEIGSISKTFTGILLADAVHRNQLALDDAAQKYLPLSVILSKHNATDISLRHLATHSSGLPRMPSNFAPANPADPYADYTEQQMYAFINHHTLRRPPDAAYEYSNLAMGLLGHILARHAENTYEQLLIDRICQPLNMNDTRVIPTDDMRRRLAAPHDVAGKPVSNWQIITLAGAGGIYSTIADMMKYAKANLHANSTPLTHAIKLAHTPYFTDTNGLRVGLGWHLAHDGVTRWHNGQTGGYHTWVSVHQPGNVAVVVLANTATKKIDTLGEQLTRLALSHNQ